jgi:hypothetical protein
MLFLSGYLLIGMALAAVLNAFFSVLPGYLIGVPVWISALLLWPRLKSAQRKQTAVLLLTGAPLLLFGTVYGDDPQYLLKALEANYLVLAMLVGVSFLRLVAMQGVHSDEQLPRGRTALWQTLLGAHLIGSVINISSVLIVGDRLSARQPLQPVQALVLLRSFSICAFWSPFFAAMGLTLVSAPGAELKTLVLFGLPVALAGLLFSMWEVARAPAVEQARGYPMHLKALWMPLVLAVLVVICHEIWPAISVLTLVTLISILFAVSWLLLRQKRQGGRRLLNHIHEGLPGLAGEVMLFLAAAVLAAGVASSLSAFDLALAPEHYGALEACITLLVLILLAFAGMHPVTSVVLVGSILAPSVSDPNLLGLTMLMGWALGVGLSPLSGVQLSLRARYSIPAVQLMRLNRLYAPVMLLVCWAVLWLFTRI